MKVYVAASSREMARAMTAFRMVRSIPGVELAHDWVTQIQEVEDANPDVPDPLRVEWATGAVEAIRESSVLWLLLPETQTIGAWVELGVALGFNAANFDPKKLIVTSGVDSIRARSIFTATASARVREDREAADLIRYHAG